MLDVKEIYSSSYCSVLPEFESLIRNNVIVMPCAIFNEVDLLCWEGEEDCV